VDSRFVLVFALDVELCQQMDRASSSRRLEISRFESKMWTLVLVCELFGGSHNAYFAHICRKYSVHFNSSV
jgi:hypothetical protein